MSYKNIQTVNEHNSVFHILPYKECIFTHYAHCTENSCAWQQHEEACPLKLYNPYNAQRGKGLH